MPLKIPNAESGSISILNTWAEGRENDILQHSKQITQVNTKVNDHAKSIAVLQAQVEALIKAAK